MLKISEIILKGRFNNSFLIFLTGVMYYFAKDVRMSSTSSILLMIVKFKLILMILTRNLAKVKIQWL